MSWKILGWKNTNKKLTWLCIMEADSFDEAIEKARNHYGCLFTITGAQPL